MADHFSGTLVNEASNTKTKTSFEVGSGNKPIAALTNADYRKNHCMTMKVSIGARSHEDCPF